MSHIYLTCGFSYVSEDGVFDCRISHIYFTYVGSLMSQEMV